MFRGFFLKTLSGLRSAIRIYKKFGFVYSDNEIILQKELE